MTSQGSPYARFRRALSTGNLFLVRAAARELPTVGLDDALAVCVLVARQDPGQLERAALRWVARYCLELPEATIARARAALGAFERMPGDPEAALGELQALFR